ncbi:MAG: hypothetical protein ACK5N8_00420 [Alphaproteobacteria bacterium]
MKQLNLLLNLCVTFLLRPFTTKEKIGEYRKFLGFITVNEKQIKNKLIKFFCFKRAKYVYNSNVGKAVTYLRKRHEFEIIPEVFEKRIELLMKINDMEVIGFLGKIYNDPQEIYSNVKRETVEAGHLKQILFSSCEQALKDKEIYHKYVVKLSENFKNQYFGRFQNLVLTEEETEIVKHIESQNILKISKQEIEMLKNILSLMLAFPEYIYDIRNVFKIAAIVHKCSLLKTPSSSKN